MLSHPMKLLFFVFALSALLAAATPVVEARGGDLCANGKKTMCCGELGTFSPTVLGLLSGLMTTVVGLLGEITTPTGLVGLKCVPITILGDGGLSKECQTHGVCCKDLKLVDAISVGCTPINIL